MAGLKVKTGSKTSTRGFMALDERAFKHVEMHIICKNAGP